MPGGRLSRGSLFGVEILFGVQALPAPALRYMCSYLQPLWTWSFAPCERLLYAADGASQSRACRAESVERVDLVIIGTSQRILRRNHFDVVRYSGAEPASREIEFFTREAQSVRRDFHLIACCFPLGGAGFDLLGDAIACIDFRLRRLFNAEFRSPPFGAEPSASEERQ